MRKKRTRHFIFFIVFIIAVSCQKKKEVSLSDMALIPEGEFIMGSNEGDVDETPERKINLKSFLIDKYDVTNEQYKKFVAATNRPEPKNWFFTGYDSKLKDHPVSFVDFKNAKAYCAWLGKRLPTEEEWEKAARGTDGRKYPWGNHFDKSKANTSLGGIMGTVPVDYYSSGQSPYGVFNMAGNVWGWTSSRGKSDEKMIVKGGSWGLSHRFSRTFSRVEYETKARVNNIGFRCALDK
jgi:formylglycine-generating enzyme required for sulfatase activity